jgi:hypothetical protein
VRAHDGVDGLERPAHVPRVAARALEDVVVLEELTRGLTI